MFWSSVLTNEEQGKQVFVDDIQQLVVDMKVVPLRGRSAPLPFGQQAQHRGDTNS